MGEKLTKFLPHFLLVQLPSFGGLSVQRASGAVEPVQRNPVPLHDAILVRCNLSFREAVVIDEMLGVELCGTFKRTIVSITAQRIRLRFSVIGNSHSRMPFVS